VSRDRAVYLRHVQDLIARIKSYTTDGETAFKTDTKTQDAVLHNLEIIGQCIKDYGVDDLEQACPGIPWIQIAAFRNVLAHKYLGVDIDLIWVIVARDLRSWNGRLACWSVGHRLPTEEFLRRRLLRP
jgi:uncharacterized protein with HEPN domain